MNLTTNLADYFIIQLGKEGERICDSYDSNDPFYNTLADLVCKESIRGLPSHLIITKPFYPYILLSYYMLFYKGDLDLAKAIYKRLLNIHTDSPNAFDRDEKASIKIIGEVIESFDALRELDDHKSVLKYHLEFLVAKLNKVDCVENGWSCFFKELVIAELEPDFDKRYEKLSSIKKKYEIKHTAIDEELIEGYNLFEEFSPAYEFLLSIAERELEDLHVRSLFRKRTNVKRLEKIIFSK